MKLYDVYFYSQFQGCAWAQSPEEAIAKVVGVDYAGCPAYEAQCARGAGAMR